MRFVVVAKAVPVQESIRVDRLRGSLDRSGVELLINPFDARALQVALLVRQPGETVTGVSMGPEAAEHPLREMLAAGADRAVHLIDPALSGSDSLVTARVLARAVTEVGADVVLAGARSTDSETGQLPAELAELLRLPMISHARSLTRGAGAGEWEFVVDRRAGWARLRARPPFVVSVGEKIAKPAKPSDAERARAALGSIERRDIAGLGLSEREVGLEGSPTRVTRLTVDAPSRSPVIFADGTVGERVKAAVARLRSLRPGARAIPAARPEGIGGPGPGKLWVLVTNSEGGFDRDSLPLLAEMRRVWPGAVRTAVAVGDDLSEESLGALAAGGATETVRVPTRGKGIDSSVVSGAIRVIELRIGPSAAGLILSDPFGREVAGRLAAASNVGLVGDATGFSTSSDGTIRWNKPAFAGEYVAEIVCRTRPALATVRPGVFAPPDPSTRHAPIPETVLELPVENARVHTVERGEEGDPRFGDLDRADRVVTVGMGIGGPEGISRLLPTLERWGAALGATRKVVDSGWLPVRCQVGLTGRSLAPELAILLGVGKAQNHVIGLRRAGALLAVNPDPAAPVFRHVDVGIVAGWEETLPELEAALSRSFPPGLRSRP